MTVDYTEVDGLDDAVEVAARAIHDVEYGDQPEHKDCDWSDMREVWTAYARAALLAALPVLDAAEAAASKPCDAEMHSWEVFSSNTHDSYWMRCNRLGPHDKHENSDTGATWRD